MGCELQHRASHEIRGYTIRLDVRLRWGKLSEETKEPPPTGDELEEEMSLVGQLQAAVALLEQIKETSEVAADCMALRFALCFIHTAWLDII